MSASIQAVDRADDLALASAAAAGDERALRALLDRIVGKLRGVAWHMCRDHHEAQDLCQEALLKVTSAAVLTRYRGDGPLDAYLVHVAVNRMLSLRRTRSSRDWRSVAITDTVGQDSDPGGPADPAPSLDSALRAALQALPERARLIVLLIAVADYSYEDTAQALGLRVGTVKSAYSRARAALRRALATQPAEPPSRGAGR